MAECGFETWLTEKLKSLDLDVDVYFNYVKGVFDEDSDLKEIRESLQEILSGILEENVDETCEEIISKWRNFKTGKDEVVESLADRDQKIKSIIAEQQSQTIEKSKHVDSEFKRLVLQQYVDSDEERNDDDARSDSNKGLTFTNTNAEAVVKEQQFKREAAKKESEEKRVRDKQNLLKDKQKKLDRQENEKKRTQKGERRAR